MERTTQFSFAKVNGKNMMVKTNGYSSKEPEDSVLVCDAEALLTLPYNKSDLMYYKLKLNCHNFTFVNLKCSQVSNYFWTEVNGGLSASEFITCYINQHKKLSMTIQP